MKAPLPLHLRAFCTILTMVLCSVLSVQLAAQEPFTTTIPTTQTRCFRLDLRNAEALSRAISTKTLLPNKMQTAFPNDGAPYLSISQNTFSRGVLGFSPLRIDIPDVAPFLCFGVKLKVKDADENNLHVFVRPLDENAVPLQSNLGQNSIGLPFDHDADDISEANTAQSDMNTGVQALTTTLAFLPKETRQVELRIECERSVQHGEPRIYGIEIFAYNPLASSDVSLAEQTTMRKAGGQLRKNVAETHNSSFPRPSFQSRTEWGCPWGQTSGPNTLTPTPPTHLIVHHSFSPGNDVKDWAAAVRGVWTYHVMSNGWSDIGYNWLIDPSGTIYQGRAWVDSNDNALGAHFCGFNRNTMGVCMLGDFTSITPTDAALKSLVRLLAYRASANNIDVRARSFHASSQRDLNNISGHRDGCSTECPGNALYPLLPTLRNRVFAIQNPPRISNQAVVKTSCYTSEISCRVQTNSSATDVFIEWGRTESSTGQNPGHLNRQFVQRINADNIDTPISTILTTLNPAFRYMYRFVAQNSDTSSFTPLDTFTPINIGTQCDSHKIPLLVAPNPASNEAVLSYHLASASDVEAQLVSSRGEVVTTLLHATQAAGEYRIPMRTESLANGIYYCRVFVRGAAGEARQIVPFAVVK